LKRARSAAPQPIAVGRLAGSERWVGFVEAGDGFQLAFGRADGSHRRSRSTGSARRRELLATAAAHYGEALDPPPPEIEATQADLGDLVRWLLASEDDARRRVQLTSVVDAIDDGLAGEVVLSRLSEALRDGETKEQADAVDLLVARLESIDSA
jgi:hypothetical protein